MKMYEVRSIPRTSIAVVVPLSAIGLDEETYAALQRESARFGDLLMLDCQEGYGEGASEKRTVLAGGKRW